MIEFLKSWMEYAKANPEAESSISSLATSYNMGRRKVSRICYPPYGDLDYLPKILIDGNLVSIYDISIGGLGLAPHGSSTSGEQINVELKWRNTPSFHTKAISVASYKHSSHLKFQNLETNLEKRLHSCLLPQLSGQRFQLIRLENAPFRCLEEEVWVSSGPDNLLLQSHFGIFHLANEEIHINIGEGIYLKTDDKRQLIRDTKKIAQLIICLWNFNRPTRSLMAVRDYAYSYWRVPPYA